MIPCAITLTVDRAARMREMLAELSEQNYQLTRDLRADREMRLAVEKQTAQFNRIYYFGHLLNNGSK